MGPVIEDLEDADRRYLNQQRCSSRMPREVVGGLEEDPAIVVVELVDAMSRAASWVRAPGGTTVALYLPNSWYLLESC